MRDLAGKVAFITGGASGIGLGMARAFVAAGMKVVITYRNPEHLSAALAFFRGHEPCVHAIELEVTDRDAMRRAADRAERVFGHVHVLCNNAAIGITVPIVEATFDDWDWALDVNVGGIINGIQTFLPRIRSHGQGGHIVSTASMGGLFNGANVGIYNTTKYAVVGMMEALRGDLANTDIGVSVLCPGLVDTNIHETETTRPERYSQSARQLDPAERQARAAWFKQNILLAGMDPLEVGELVLDGIRENHLYILTHPEYEAGLRERFEAILASFPRERMPPEARVRAEARVLRHPMYALERDRRTSEEGSGNRPAGHAGANLG
jgi:NAD(P)-dependent dehydrogenase (short-subunit alcohol dehydrogenase family)